MYGRHQCHAFLAVVTNRRHHRCAPTTLEVNKINYPLSQPRWTEDDEALAFLAGGQQDALREHYLGRTRRPKAAAMFDRWDSHRVASFGCLGMVGTKHQPIVPFG